MESDDGELRVGVRRLCRRQSSMPSSVLSSQSMHLGVLATASHVVTSLKVDWVDSKWRSLKIQWDEPASIQRPNRVSTWEIEPFVASASLNLAQPTAKTKRARPADIQISENQASSPFWYHGSAHSQEITQFGGTVEVQSNENPVAWPAKPKKKPISAIGEGVTRRDHLVEKWNMFNLLLWFIWKNRNRVAF
ncbi:hypothetical protein ACFE04_023309 [Oxalis oulophora]